MTMPSHFIVNNFQGKLLAAMLVAVALAGCGDKKGDKAATQVAANVNGTEISLHQVNHVLSKIGNIPADKIDLARKNVLDQLIDQELLAAKAVQEKLDRAPDTLMALELARREILARAYMEQVFATSIKLSSGDVTKYYMTHPELFFERKVYNLQEITFPKEGVDPAEVEAQIKKGRTMDEILEFLKTHNVAAKSSAGVRAAEQLPLGYLKQLHTAKDGETLLLNDAQGYNVIRVVGTRSMPVDEVKATPGIQQFLFNQRAGELKAKQLTALKEQAKIEYVGAFADLAKAPAAAAPAPVAPAAQAPATPQATAPASTEQAAQLGK